MNIFQKIVAGTWIAVPVTGLLSLFLLVACGPKVPDIKHEYEFVPVPSTLRTKAATIPPPDAVKYKAAEPSDREKMLFDVIGRQNKEIEKANLRFLGIDQWNDDQTKAWADAAKGKEGVP